MRHRIAAKTGNKSAHGTANARQHSGYSISSIHTLYTAEILQPANGCRKEETRATTLCMAWHAQQEASSCATIPTDTGWRGHSASNTSVAPGGVTMRVQYKQGHSQREIRSSSTQPTAEEYDPNLLARSQICGRVFARVRAHVQACSRVRVLMHALHACICLRVVRSACACACIHARVCLRVCVRMPACSCADACVRVWSGPRVPGCMRVCARALVCVMCMCMHILVRMRACVCVCALMREYACINLCACTDKCM